MREDERQHTEKVNSQLRWFEARSWVEMSTDDGKGRCWGFGPSSAGVYALCGLDRVRKNCAGRGVNGGGGNGIEVCAVRAMA